MNATTFNDAQREVLGVISCLEKEEDLKALKKVLVQFLNERLQNHLDSMMDNGTLTQEKMDSWETSHFRTPYN